MRGLKNVRAQFWPSSIAGIGRYPSLECISDAPPLLDEQYWHVFQVSRLPAGLPDWLMPIAAIVPGQLLAMHLAIARGIDPESPCWIAKITRTN